MTENEIRQIDEASTAISRTIPSMLWNFYQALIVQGFDEAQSLELTKTYLGETLNGNKNL